MTYRVDTKSMDYHSNKTKGDNAKVWKAELSFLYATCCLVLFYISAKYQWNIPKGTGVTERTRNLFQIKQTMITPKVRKPELSILYATCHLVLIYISTNYHQNIPKGIQVTERTRSFTAMATGSFPPHLLVGGHNYTNKLSSIQNTLKECIQRSYFLMTFVVKIIDSNYRVNNWFKVG